MSVQAEETIRLMGAGTRRIEQLLDGIKSVRIPRTPHVFVAAGILGMLAVGGVAWMVYRSRRRRKLIRRFQDALPTSVRELQHELRSKVAPAK